MPTAPSIARPSPGARSRRVPLLAAGLAAIAIAAAALLVIVSSVLDEPSRVDFVVENPTVFEMNIYVEPADGGAGLGLGTVSRESDRAFSGVIDQGDRWHLEFSYGGIVAAELVVARADLEEGPVVVPSSAEEVLREAGLPPTPR